MGAPHGWQWEYCGKLGACHSAECRRSNGRFLQCGQRDHSRPKRKSDPITRRAGDRRRSYLPQCTIVHAGTLFASSLSSTAVGTGDVTVESAHAVFPNSAAKVSIALGAHNAIADTATLSLAGGNVPNVADDGYLELAGSGPSSYVNETVRALRLAGIPQPPGTYGSTSSFATYKLNEFFSGGGLLTVLTYGTGDYNVNGVVDAADYVIWRKQNGIHSQFLAADGSGNGAVGVEDHTYWRERFGNSPGAGSGSLSSTNVIPEPATILLFILALSLAVSQMRLCR